MKKLTILWAFALLASGMAWGGVYTGNSVYTSPYTNDAYTRALWHFDETAGPTASNFTDASATPTTGFLGATPAAMRSWIPM